MKTFDLQRADISVDKSPGKRNLAPENGDSRRSVDDKVEGQIEKGRHTFLDNMDAIACGVQARFEESSGFSRRVVETTVDIARALRVPESDIKRWASSRLIHDTEKLNVIKSRLERLQRSFLDRADNKREPRRAIRSDPT